MSFIPSNWDITTYRDCDTHLSLVLWFFTFKSRANFNSSLNLQSELSVILALKAKSGGLQCDFEMGHPFGVLPSWDCGVAALQQIRVQPVNQQEEEKEVVDNGHPSLHSVDYASCVKPELQA